MGYVEQLDDFGMNQNILYFLDRTFFKFFNRTIKVQAIYKYWLFVGYVEQLDDLGMNQNILCSINKKINFLNGQRN